MTSVRRFDQLPENFSDFVDEIGTGLRGLYGPAAEAEYRASARGSMMGTIENPQVAVFALGPAPKALGFIVALQREDIGYISFIHILDRNTGKALEERLVTKAVEHLKRGGSRHIVSECVAHCALDLERVYKKEGFIRVKRAIMGASCSQLVNDLQGPSQSREFHSREARAAARTIVDSFRHHDGRLLHHEVRTIDRAHGFLKSVRAGAYGRFLPPYARAIDEDRALTAVLVGCQVAPDMGFVLMVSVIRERQGHGLGTLLMKDVAREFLANGLDRLALGVSLDNPAKRLYQRQGFSLLKRVDAYVTPA